ncbi:MAG: restriction endonuclease, partial [Zavarzinella sp.]|nr:restriction endonuclease [Zavarzinella sp.]
FLGRGDTTIYQESPEQIVNRVCREFGKARNIVVLNDEAHHCYRPKPRAEGEPGEKLTGEDKRESEERNEAAALWLTGLEAVQRKIGVQAVYDLSATPFYLRGSGYVEGTLFPWVVSDFALIDAIESGIVKVPRVPVADSSTSGELPTFRDLWVRIREGLPKRTRGAEGDVPLNLPRDLEAALLALYAHYEQSYREWEADPEGRTPPVFIVVCNNTAVSKMVFDWIAGRDTDAVHHDNTPVMTAGNLRVFSNSDGGRRLHRPNTILVDSAQLESDEGMSADFKKLAAGQIEEFKAEYRRRFPGRDAEGLKDADLMREVLNTVGKAGKLGENVKCVVSVSMLTEGWDCNTVTHILGVRAFGTQLLCEQVIGRGLRRMDFTVNADGHFEPEYAEVIGVPFRFLPCAAIPKERPPAKQTPPGRVAADPARLTDRPWLEITFPRVAQYRYQLPPQMLSAKFGPESRVILTTERITTEAEVAPIVGEDTRISLDELKTRRLQEVAFRIARLVIDKYALDGTGPAWLFPQVLDISRRWLAEQVVCKDDTFPQLLLLTSEAHQAAEKIHRAITDANPGERIVRAVLQDQEGPGTTAKVSFETRKKTWRTDPKKCHINFVPEDSGWESKFAQTLEGMPEVLAYVKNQSLGFRIPYTLEGVPGNYYPDFILKVDDGRGPADPLNVVVEISGRDLLDKQAKADTAAKLWVPAVNHERTFGRWAFLEVRDPYNAKADLREFVETHRNGRGCGTA